MGVYLCLHSQFHVYVTSFMYYSYNIKCMWYRVVVGCCWRVMVSTIHPNVCVPPFSCRSPVSSSYAVVCCWETWQKIHVVLCKQRGGKVWSRNPLVVHRVTKPLLANINFHSSSRTLLIYLRTHMSCVYHQLTNLSNVSCIPAILHLGKYVNYWHTS